MTRKPDRPLGTNPRSATERPVAAVILAAGEGKRMKSATAKVLHRVAGRSLVEHVVQATVDANVEPVIVVVGVQAEAAQAQLQESFPSRELLFAVQKERRGTADAVLRAGRALERAGRASRFDGDALILCGDVPALPANALSALIRRHRSARAVLTVMTTIVSDPRGYGRIVRNDKGQIRAIVEERDASPSEREIREINSGTYCANWRELVRVLRKVRPDNAQGELYLTDAVRLLLAEQRRVDAVVHGKPDELQGVNSRLQLSEVGRTLNRQTLDRLMEGGVTVIDPATTWIDRQVRIGRDTILHPGVTVEGRTRLGAGCVVRSGVRLTDVTAADGAVILDHTVAVGSTIGKGTIVGPFAHLRPGTSVGPECKIGNFVETKNTRIGSGSKASHLSYLGDADIGRRVNVGAGTITCNYDGVKKHRTQLGDGVFIGSDTQLVAPVTLGKDVYVAAGTTVTKDVPAGALAIGRAVQKNVSGWVARRRAKLVKAR